MNIERVKKYEPIEGKWRVTKELGSGAFGTVFEIERIDFPDVKAALKVITIPQSKAELDSFRQENFDMDEKSITSYYYGYVENFQNEIKMMLPLAGNSNIASYMNDEIIPHEGDVGWDILIRMELLTPINNYYKEHPPTEKDIIKLGIDICRALEVCGKYNIIHRDIKPSNIFISDVGDYKLGDFGVARTMEKTTGVLSKKGTVTYMSPEVYKGESYGSTVDIYSLGIVLYRLMNNNLEPFRTDRTFADAENANFKRMNGEKMPAPANAGEELSRIILKACSYNVADRYKTPAEMRKELESINTLDGNTITSENNTSKLNSIEETSETHDTKISSIGEETVGIFDLSNKQVMSGESNIDKTVGIFDSKENNPINTQFSNKAAKEPEQKINETKGKTEVQNISKDKQENTLENKSTILVKSELILSLIGLLLCFIPMSHYSFFSDAAVFCDILISYSLLYEVARFTIIGSYLIISVLLGIRILVKNKSLEGINWARRFCVCLSLLSSVKFLIVGITHNGDRSYILCIIPMIIMIIIEVLIYRKERK